MKGILRKAICSLLVLTMVLSMTTTSFAIGNTNNSGKSSLLISDVYTEKFMYSWGDTVSFQIKIKNDSDINQYDIMIESSPLTSWFVSDETKSEIPILVSGEETIVEIEYLAQRPNIFIVLFSPIIALFKGLSKASFDASKRVRVGIANCAFGFNISSDSNSNKDSDGDGFSDYDELYLMGTDPNVYNDPNNDTDRDGLTDGQEVHDYNTDIKSMDSDNDALTDYEEVITYKTNPNAADTDGDGLSDGFEIKHGLNPLKKSTDGIHEDSEVEIEQELDDSGISSELKSENIAPPTVSGLASGELVNNVFVSTSSESTLQDNRAIVGKPVFVDGESDYIDGLTLSFDLSAYNGDKDSLAVVKVNDDGNFELVESSLTGSAITCELESGGDYCLIDIGKFLRELGIDISDANSSSVKAAAEKEISGQADVVFAIDTTGSMSGTINNVINNVAAFSASLAKNYNVNIHFALIDFKDITSDGKDSTKVISDGYQNWYSDVDSFIKSVKTLRATGGGDTPECDVDALETARQLNFRRTASKFIILITDTYFKVANNYGIKSMDEEIDLLKKDGIRVSVVTSTSYANTYKSLYESTGGIFANISSSSFSTSLMNLASLIGEDTSDGKWVILKHGYRYVKLPEIPSSGSSADTDGDGISDYTELGKETTVDLSLFVQAELAMKGIPFSEFTGKTAITVYDAISDPTLADSDGDGINDKKDTAPWNKGLKDGIVGELVLLSCEGDSVATVALDYIILGGANTGHAFIIYQSFIQDSFDVSRFSNGFSTSTGSWKSKEDIERSYSAQSYGLGINECISMGAGGYTTADATCAVYNMEFVKRFELGYTYNPNAYITKEVTQSDVEKLQSSFAQQSKMEYRPVKHNCTHVALDVWNAVFNTNLDPLGINTPKGLKKLLSKQSGCGYNYNLDSIIS